MNKRKYIISKVITAVLVFTLVSGVFCASSSKQTSTDRPVSTSEAEANLSNTQKVIQAEDYSASLQWGCLDEYANAYLTGAYGTETLMFLLDTGRMLGYLDDFKAAGIVDQNYVSPYVSSGSSEPKIVEAPTPEPVTTEKCEEKIMWAKSTVNIRENGSTAYTKTGSLKKDEQVTVTGIDSTGWYEIRTSDGTVGHVSNKYLTEVDPSVSNAVNNTDDTTEDAVPSAIPTQESYIISIEERTVTWFNAETGEEEVVEFDENIPLEQIEDCANRFLLNREDYIVTPTPEPTAEPTATPEPTVAPSQRPEPTVESTVTPTPEVSLVHQITNSVWFVVFGFGLGIVCIILGFVWWKKR